MKSGYCIFLGCDRLTGPQELADAERRCNEWRRWLGGDYWVGWVEE